MVGGVTPFSRTPVMWAEPPNRNHTVEPRIRLQSVGSTVERFKYLYN
jgi:hypothetical protein